MLKYSKNLILHINKFLKIPVLISVDDKSKYGKFLHPLILYLKKLKESKNSFLI